MMKYLPLALILLLPVFASAQTAPKTDPWQPFHFLMGDWVADNGPGQSTGTFSFAADLDQHVLVRKNHAESPATADRPAGTHDDLMIVYQESAEALKAIYFDNEGHTIHYAVEPQTSPDTLVFISDPAPKAPRFRLTYARLDSASVSIEFAIAPPGSDAFNPYVSGKAHRRSGQ